MSKRSKPKKNNSFVHQFLDMYSTKGAGFAMLLMYKYFKGDSKAVNDVIPSLRKEAIKRGLNMDTLFKELNRAVGTIDGTGELRADSNNEVDQPQDEDGPSKTRANDGSSGSQEEGSS
jgi:SpoU rRNA methylase family enzyme